MRLLLGALLNRWFGRRVKERDLVDAGSPPVLEGQEPETPALTYPSDEIVAQILSAIDEAPMDLGRLQAIVRLSREDLKSGVAALSLEGMIDLVIGATPLHRTSPWIGSARNLLPEPPAPSICITSRGVRFLSSLKTSASNVTKEQDGPSTMPLPLDKPPAAGEAVA